MSRRLLPLIASLLLQGCAHGEELSQRTSASPKQAIVETVADIVTDEKRSVPEKETIKILMLLWRGVTETETAFLEDLKTRGYEVRLDPSDTINAERNLKRLKQELHNLNAYPHDYDYVYASGRLATLIAIEWAQGQCPILFSGVSRSESVNITGEHTSDREKVSGVANVEPIRAQLDGLQQIARVTHLKLDRLAVIVNSDDQSCMDTYNIFEKACTAQGIELKRFGIARNASGDQLVHAFQQEEILPSIIMVLGEALTAAQAKVFFEYTRRLKLVTITERADILDQGGCFGIIVDPRSVGIKLAEILQANRRLNIKMEHIPTQAGSLNLYFNSTVAKEIGLWPKELEDQGLLCVPTSET